MRQLAGQGAVGLSPVGSVDLGLEWELGPAEVHSGNGRVGLGPRGLQVGGLGSQWETPGLGGRKGSLQQRRGRVDVELAASVLRGGVGGLPGPEVAGATERASYGEKENLSEGGKVRLGNSNLAPLTPARHPHRPHRQMKGKVSAQATRSSGLPESSR